MLQTLEAVICEDGRVVLEESIHLARPHRAIDTILEEPHDTEGLLLAESSLKEDWLRPEEDEAWACFQ